jgi:hypothetical protein
MSPSPRSSKVIGAVVGAVAALSIGGVGLAFAQEAETPTTDAPAVETPSAPGTAETPRDGEDCPDKAGDAGDAGEAGDGADAGASSTDV